MEPRAQRQALRAHLGLARAAFEEGRAADAASEIEAALRIDPQCLAAHALREQLTAGVTAGAARVESRRAMPPPGPSGAAWGRLEARARARHLERRAAAARAAIERRRLDEAREALAEIRDIDPTHPVLDELGRSLHLAAGAAHDCPPRQGRRAAVLLTLVVAGAGGWVAGPRLGAYIAQTLAMPRPMPSSGSHAGRPADTVAIQPMAPAPARPLVSIPAAGLESRVLDGMDTRPAGVPSAAETRTDSGPDRRGNPTRAVILPNPQPAPPAPASAPRPVASAPAAAPPVTQAPQQPPRAAEVAAPAATAGATDARRPGSPAEPAPPAAVSAAAPDLRPADTRVRESDDALVRRALQQFRSAYDTLDAEAARVAWPGVDSVALQRAFDGLRSQRLTFDTCDVRVSGPLGTATCRGSARYVPKIGSREPRVERRTWTFVLRRSGEDWRIDSARVQQ